MAFISSKTRKISKKPHVFSRQKPKFIYTFIIFSLFTTLIIILLSMDKPKIFEHIYIMNNLNFHVLLIVLFDNLYKKSLCKCMINKIADKLKHFGCIHNISNPNLHEFSKILFDNLYKRFQTNVLLIRLRTSYIALTDGNQ